MCYYLQEYYNTLQRILTIPCEYYLQYKFCVSSYLSTSKTTLLVLTPDSQKPIANYFRWISSIFFQHARTGATKKKRGKRSGKKGSAKKAESPTSSEAEGEDEADVDFACKKCATSDHPDWILLCDKCDDGWHASCLRPALMVIPEGNWWAEFGYSNHLNSGLVRYLNGRK